MFTITVICFKMTEWLKEITLQFLELYQSEPALWDPKHCSHKHKKKTNDAWVRISESLEISVPELKKKKDSLMATFRGHLRKKKASIKSGASADDIYKPIWFAYSVMEEFLGPIYECTNTETPEGTSQASLIDEEEVTMINTGDAAPTSVAPTSTGQTVRQRVTNPPELQEAQKQMKEAFNTLNNMLRRKNTEEDEYDLFGRLLAKKLRKLPENESALFMYEIDGMFINKIRHTLNSSSYSHPFHIQSSSSNNNPRQQPSSSYSRNINGASFSNNDKNEK